MRTNSSGLIAIVLSGCLWSAPAAAAQSDVDPAAEAQAAERASARGDHAAAEAAYDRILAAKPGGLAALVARGDARAFQGKYAGARADYEAALARQPEHLGALVGLGHALSWSGKQAEAITQFERALAVAPRNVDAQRGAGYAELWRGNPTAAVARFETLLAQEPQDVSAAEGLAQARAALAPRRAHFEAISWYGHSELPGGESESGLRQAELAYWPSERLRLFARYDDGLSRDNASLVRANRGAPLASVGAYSRWSQSHGTLIEIGHRSFPAIVAPGDVDQMLYRIEHSLYLDGGHEAKLGGWYGPRDDDRNEWLLYAGGGIAFAPGWRLEPTVFYSRNGLPGGNEWRVLLAGHWNAGRGWEFGGGVAGGRAHENDQDREVREFFLRGSYALTPTLRLQLLARRESISGSDALTVLALGAAFDWR